MILMTMISDNNMITICDYNADHNNNDGHDQ